MSMAIAYLGNTGDKNDSLIPSSCINTAQHPSQTNYSFASMILFPDGGDLVD